LAARELGYTNKGIRRSGARLLELPVIPVREMTPVIIGREPSMRALKAAAGEHLVLTAQKDPQGEPTEDNMFGFGTLAKVEQTIRLPDGSLQVLVEGISRARVEE
jgi:ATP-dependent Lon protease